MDCVTCGYWKATIGDQCEACFEGEGRGSRNRVSERLSKAADPTPPQMAYGNGKKVNRTLAPRS